MVEKGGTYLKLENIGPIEHIKSESNLGLKAKRNLRFTN